MDKAFWEVAETVISGKMIGKDATPESVNSVREILAAYQETVQTVCQAFDDHLKNGRMNDGKVINRDYLKGVSFFRNPKGWTETTVAETPADVIAGLQAKLAGKTSA